MSASIHEQFQTDAPVKQLRQDRYAVGDWTCFLSIGDGRGGNARLDVVDYSAFGIAAVSPTRLAALDVEASLRLEDVEIQRLSMRVVRQERTDEGKFKVAFEITGEPLSLTRLDAAARAKAAIAEHKKMLERAAGIPPEFRRKVYEIQHGLEELEHLVGDLERQMRQTNKSEAAEIEQSTVDVVANHLRALFATAYDEVADVLHNMSDAESKRCYEFFRENLKHLLYQSPLSERIYEKPLGYAGDHEMMSFIYRSEDVGQSLFARCLHRYYVTHPNARAVRNRAEFLFGKLTARIASATRPLRILSVACGPVMEIEMLMRQPGFDPSRVEFYLLDQDLTALQVAHKRINTVARELGIRPNVQYLHKAIRNIVKEGLETRFDLIYSAGLFDYFSDPVARLAAASLYKMLGEGGELIIGNFTTEAQSRVLMELALDWHLIYRSDADLRSLYGGVCRAIDVEMEPEGINLFASLKR